MSVYQKIAAVTSALAAAGISKDQTNSFDRYNFRGIDDVYNALAPLLAEHKLVILPTCEESVHTVVQTSQGKPANHVSVMVSYRFVDAESGSSEEQISFTNVRVPGEATDRGDKAENKAMSAAYKLMAFQTFCIPVEGGSADSESETIEHGPALMSDEQRQEILGLCMQSNSNVDEFLKWAGFDKMLDIPANQFQRLKHALDQKLAKQTREYAQEQSTTAQSMEGGQ